MTRLSGSLWLDLSHWVFVLTKVERCWNGHAGRMGWNSNLSFYLSLVLWNAVACLSYLSSSEICDHFSMGYDCTFDILWQPSNTDSASISLLTPQQVSLRSVLLSESTPCHAAMMILIPTHPTHPTHPTTHPTRSYPAPEPKWIPGKSVGSYASSRCNENQFNSDAMGFFVLISWNTLKSIEIIQLGYLWIYLDSFEREILLGLMDVPSGLASPTPRVSHRSCNASHSCPSRSAAKNAIAQIPGLWS